MTVSLYENLNLIDTLARLAEGELELDETDGKQHNPFRHHKKLGNKTPGGRHGADEVGDWQCHKTAKYAQKCIGVGPDTEGRVKNIKISKGWKKNYNHDMKTGVASGKYTPAARSGGSGKKSKKAA